MRIIRPSTVSFIDDKTEKRFNELDEKDEVKIWIKRAIEDLKKNAFCAIPLPKRLMPLEYVKKYNAQNLWKYDLPDGWRLIYTITNPSKVEILSVILEWFDHPNYEKRFGY